MARKCAVSQFWTLEAPHPGVSKLCSLRQLWERVLPAPSSFWGPQVLLGLWPLPSLLCTTGLLLCVRVSSTFVSDQDTCHWSQDLPRPSMIPSQDSDVDPIGKAVKFQ